MSTKGHWTELPVALGSGSDSPNGIDGGGSPTRRHRTAGMFAAG